jgi:Flp pilus assembly protein TadD
MRRAKPALSFVYVQGTDTVGHTFAPYAPPRQPAIPAEEFARYSPVPEAYFREVDRMLGDYRRIAEEQGAAILVVSDHGFLWGEGRPPRPDSLAQATAGLWHREEGVYVVWGPGIDAEAARGSGQAGQSAATILALLGLPRGRGLDGPALAGIAESGQTRDYGPRTAGARASADPAAAEALEKLRALGYVGGAEPEAAAAGDAGTRTAGSFNNEGLLLREAGRKDEARRAFEEALRVDPKSASAAHNLSVLLTESDPGRADALLLDAVANGLGDGPRILVAAADAHAKAGDADRARRLVDGAVERLPSEPGPRVLRGRRRLEAQDCAGALADFQAARKIAPGAALIHGLEGTALLCLGRETEGRAALERSLALDPSQARLREQLARTRH